MNSVLSLRKWNLRFCWVPTCWCHDWKRPAPNSKKLIWKTTAPWKGGVQEKETYFLGLLISVEFLRVQGRFAFQLRQSTDKKPPVLVNESMIYRFTSLHCFHKCPFFPEVWKMEAMVSLVVLQGWDFSLQLSLRRRVPHIWDSSHVVEKWHRRGWLSWWDVVAGGR